MRIAVVGLLAPMCESAAPFALLHRVVQPFAPVAGLALGVGDGIDDDVIVEFLKDDVKGEDAHVAMADFPLDGECAGIGG